jgi:hypothetical protein
MGIWNPPTHPHRPTDAERSEAQTPYGLLAGVVTIWPLLFT